MYRLFCPEKVFLTFFFISMYSVLNILSSKKLLHTLFLLVFKIVESLQCSLNTILISVKLMDCITKCLIFAVPSYQVRCNYRDHNTQGNLLEIATSMELLIGTSSWLFYMYISFKVRMGSHSSLNSGFIG